MKKRIFFSILILLLSASLQGQTQIDSLFQQLLVFDYGQPPSLLEQIERLISASATDANNQRMMAKKCEWILSSPASCAAKDFACRQLALIGAEEQVPALAKLLSQEATAGMALYALGRFPRSERVDQALLKALPKAGGSTKISIINILGDRGVAQAIKPLQSVLEKEQDPQLVRSCLAALAKIGGDQAWEVIAQAAARPWFAQAALTVAEGLKPDQAGVLFCSLLQHGQNVNIRCAALAGLQRTDEKQAIPHIVQFVQEKDQNLFDAALACVRRIQDRDFGVAMVRHLSQLEVARQGLLIQALADRGDSIIATEIEKYVQDLHEPVRMAAIEALGRIGTPNSVSVLLQHAVNASDVEKTACVKSLSEIADLDAQLVILLQDQNLDSERRALVISVINNRMSDGAVPVLLRLAQHTDDQVRSESFSALANLAETKDVAMLLQLLDAGPESSLQDAEKALVSVSRRLSYDSTIVIQILDHLNACNNVKNRCSLLRVLAAGGHKRALPVLLQSLHSKDSQVQEAGLRGLAGWPDASPADDLLQFNQSSLQPLNKILALQGYLHLIASDSALSESAKIDRYLVALKAAHRAEEKKLAFSQLARLAEAKVLQVSSPFLQDGQINEEAAMAMIVVGRKIWPRESEMCKQAMQAIQQADVSMERKAQASELLALFDWTKDYLLDWQVAGPFSLASVPAKVLFNIQLDAEYDWGAGLYRPFINFFDPENPHYLNLLRTLSGNKDQVAYLITNLFSDQSRSAVLLFASSNAAKLWLNGKEVYANPTSRPFQVDQDKISVTLREGWNKILLKVIHADGPEWGASLRMQQPEGGFLSGVQISSDRTNKDPKK